MLWGFPVWYIWFLTLLIFALQSAINISIFFIVMADGFSRYTATGNYVEHEAEYDA